MMSTPPHGEVPLLSDGAAAVVQPLAISAHSSAIDTAATTAVALNDATAVPVVNSRLASPRSASTAAQQRSMRLEVATRGGTPGNPRSNLAVERQSQGTAILTAVRRQMEALEEKLSSQIARVQQQSDRLRDAAFSRVDQKMGSMEASQPKFDRRLAELSGNYKGLSDEMQAQIKRVDQLDSKLWEFRHQLEEEIRGKVAELEQGQQTASSALRLASATSDDSLKRYGQKMLRLERIVEERLAYTEETREHINDLYARLTEVESLRSPDLAICPVEHLRTTERNANAVEAMGDTASLLALESRLSDACQKIEMFQQENHDLHVKVEAQEERLKSLRTRIETQEDHHRSLSDRVERVDTEGSIKEVQRQLSEHIQRRTEQDEQLQLLHKRLESHEQVHDDVWENIRRVQLAHPSDLAEARTAELATTDAGQGLEALNVDVQECLRRLKDAEVRLDELGSDLQSAKGDVELGPRVAQLVEHLKQVAPKVVDQELSVRDLHEKVGRLEVERKMERTSTDERTATETLARIDKLEAEVQHLRAEVGTSGTTGT
eukprot:CAMPEP_0171104374 /NCGR_PEP_ID=MMETSP0766_2-20121228/60512_1 /TAXON_ID=439317 /ORGANISM="Gambierdiscus australes, Strain CAWD 149" /LENGTH=548 /DNA_ID=CAMNT_0011564993 /DNA_START=189 /DNA_END=1835 /DNA_ORIENTATION=+